MTYLEKSYILGSIFLSLGLGIVFAEVDIINVPTILIVLSICLFVYVGVKGMIKYD